MSQPPLVDGIADERNPPDLGRVVTMVLISSAALWVAFVWDISWQTTFESSTFWSPPHVLVLLLAGAVFAGTFSRTAWLMAPRAATPKSVVTGCRLMALGALTMLVGGVIDIWWHTMRPPSLQLLTPTHLALWIGLLVVWAGGLLVTLAAQDRNRDGRGGRLSGVHLVFAALIVSWVAFMATEYIGRPNLWHGSEFFWVSGGVFPVVLLAIARSSSRNWAASIATAMYAGGTILAIWVLQLVPVTPPTVDQEVIHFVPPPFPLLLVLPGLAIDVLVQRAGSSPRPRTDHVLAVVGGMAFIVILIAVHWFLGDFLLSPAGRGFVFGADHWPYHATLGEWRYQFWTREPGRRALAVGIAAAAMTAMVSTRAGLWLGDRLSTLTWVLPESSPKKTR